MIRGIPYIQILKEAYTHTHTRKYSHTLNTIQTDSKAKSVDGRLIILVSMLVFSVATPS